MKVTTTELMLDNIRAFGYRDAAIIARRRGIPFTHFYWMAFGRAPRPLAAPPTETAMRLKAIDEGTLNVPR